MDGALGVLPPDPREALHSADGSRTGQAFGTRAASTRWLDGGSAIRLGAFTPSEPHLPEIYAKTAQLESVGARP